MMPQRKWDPIHIKAGYDEQKWGPTPNSDDFILGIYDCRHHGVPMEIEVTYLPHGKTGPEYQLEWSDGMKVTVVDSATAAQYLLMDNAKKRGR